MAGGIANSKHESHRMILPEHRARMLEVEAYHARYVERHEIDEDSLVEMQRNRARSGGAGIDVDDTVLPGRVAPRGLDGAEVVAAGSVKGVRGSWGILWGF